MTPEKRETAIKWLKDEIRSLRLAPKINGCGPENWANQLEVMETCLEAVRGHGSEPLTLEQLWGMVGQPVVVKYSYGGPDAVAIVDVRFAQHLGSDKIRLVFADGHITVNEKGYGTYFTAYAYPTAHIGRGIWVNASERMPEDGQIVLVTASGKPQSNITLEYAYELAAWSIESGWILNCWPEWERAKVTHWMPLPEPPTELEKRLRVKT